MWASAGEAASGRSGGTGTWLAVGMEVSVLAAALLAGLALAVGMAVGMAVAKTAGIVPARVEQATSTLMPINKPNRRFLWITAFHSKATLVQGISTVQVLPPSTVLYSMR